MMEQRGIGNQLMTTMGLAGGMTVWVDGAVVGSTVEDGTTPVVARDRVDDEMIGCIPPSALTRLLLGTAMRNGGVHTARLHFELALLLQIRHQLPITNYRSSLKMNCLRTQTFSEAMASTLEMLRTHRS